MKTDLLLINPPTDTLQNKPTPLGLMYISSFLEEKGFKIKILDLSMHNLNDGQILDWIKKINPRKIGISCMSVDFNFLKRITKKIKTFFKDIQLITGGVHPTAMPQEVLNTTSIDVLVIGEGENTLLELMKDYNLKDIKGIAYMKNKKMVVNEPREFIEDLDKLPFPARHLLPPLKNYSLSMDWEGRKPSVVLFSSRGCPFNCIYCASKIMWKRKVRFRSAENVLKEIDFLVSKYRIKEILFYDDHFVLNKPRLVEICNGLIKRNYDLTWCCLSRVDSIELDTLKLMKKAGCHMISFGVESGSQKILDSIEKNVKISQIINAFKLCKTVGINTKATIIFGSPNETRETINETNKLLKIILPDYVWFFSITPFPGTKLYELHKTHGLSFDNHENYNQTSYNKFYGTDLRYDEIKKEIKKAYRSYYLSLSYILSQLRKISLKKISVYWELLKHTSAIMVYLKRQK